MKNKIFKSLICSTLISTLTTGCVDIGIENDNLKDNTNNYTSIVSSEDYTTQNIYNKTLKYKKANPTSLWDCNDNFGAGEIDTVLILSKDGNPVEKYYNMANISGIYFQTGDDAITSDDGLKVRYQRWYGISNLKIENIEKEPFVKHLKGETSEIYMESYSLKYKTTDNEDVYYNITLVLYKNDYDNNLISKVIDEYHLIIDTLELLD